MNRTIWLLAFAVLLAACNDSDTSQESQATPPATGDAPGPGGSNDPWGFVATLPYDYPSAAEISAVVFMREEEKLARDVYLSMHESWGQQIFANIADSEQRHMDGMLRLIQKYSLVDPAEGKLQGEFTDPNLQGLHDMLVAQGSASQIDALLVGATIEDLDIFDLHQQLEVVDNEDITQVFESLLRGSRNHMRSFHARLMDLNTVYVPQYLTQEEYDEIVNSPMESGP